MKLNTKRILVTAILGVLFGGVMSAQGIRDIIQPVKIHPEKLDTILASDLFYAKVYDLRFAQNGKIAIAFNQDENTVVFTPRPNFNGATVVQFQYDGSTYAIPVVVENLDRKSVV